MLTRNKSPIYEVNIDFDEASEAWKKNKKSMGNGVYKYVCGCDTKNGTPCQKKPYKLSIVGYCDLHDKAQQK